MKKIILLNLINKFRGLSRQTKRKLLIIFGAMTFVSVFFMGLFVYLIFSLGGKLISQVQETKTVSTIQQQSQSAFANFNINKNDPECRKQIDELFLLSTWIEFQPLGRWDRFKQTCLQTAKKTENSYNTSTDY
jgi:hypothetical protein